MQLVCPTCGGHRGVKIAQVSALAAFVRGSLSTATLP